MTLARRPRIRPSCSAAATEAFVDALCKDFEENGIGAIKVARIENPTAYLNLCASVIPKHVDLDVVDRRTELAEWMAWLQNPDIVRAMIAKPADAPKAPDLPALPPRAERPLPPRIEPFNASEHAEQERLRLMQKK